MTVGKLIQRNILIMLKKHLKVEIVHSNTANPVKQTLITYSFN